MAAYPGQAEVVQMLLEEGLDVMIETQRMRPLSSWRLGQAKTQWLSYN